MSFFKRYELVRLVSEAEAKTFEAVERSSGRPVLFHMLSREHTSQVDAMRRMPDVIEAGEFVNWPYVVTEPAVPMIRVKEWLKGKKEAPPAPPPAAVVEQPAVVEMPRAAEPPRSKPEPPPVSAGEFTSLFGDKMYEEKAPAPPPIESSHEFTRMFEDKAPTPAPVEESSHEFTRMFEEKAAPARPVTPDPVAGSSEPEPQWGKAQDTSDFTKFFGGGMRGDPIDIDEEQARQAENPEPDTRPFQQAGEFTRMFGENEGAGQAAAPPKRRTTVSSSTGLFSSELNARTTTPEPESGEKTPGEYTRLFATPKAEGEGPTPAPMVVLPAKKSRRGLWITLGVIAFALAILIGAWIVFR